MDVGTHDGVFQSTLPLRGATKSYGNVQFHLLISIHTPLAGSDSNASIKSSFGNISIHTPLAGSDARHCGNGSTSMYFNPHSPCGERHFPHALKIACKTFQSTLPLRGATDRLDTTRYNDNISIHTPLAGSDVAEILGLRTEQISIHTPLAGSDSRQWYRGQQFHISIHTPLAGSDLGAQV